MTLEPRSGRYSKVNTFIIICKTCNNIICEILKVVLWFHGLGDTADGWGSMSKIYHNKRGNM